MSIRCSPYGPLSVMIVGRKLGNNKALCKSAHENKTVVIALHAVKKRRPLALSGHGGFCFLLVRNLFPHPLPLLRLLLLPFHQLLCPVRFVLRLIIPGKEVRLVLLSSLQKDDAHPLRIEVLTAE